MLDGWLQAGEKAWVSVTQQSEIVGQEWGWVHTIHLNVENIARQIKADYPDLDSHMLADALHEANHIRHTNLYWDQQEQEVGENFAEDVGLASPYQRANGLLPNIGTSDKP